MGRDGSGPVASRSWVSPSTARLADIEGPCPHPGHRPPGDISHSRHAPLSKRRLVASLGSSPRAEAMDRPTPQGPVRIRSQTAPVLLRDTFGLAVGPYLLRGPLGAGPPRGRRGALLADLQARPASDRQEQARCAQDPACVVDDRLRRDDRRRDHTDREYCEGVLMHPARSHRSRVLRGGPDASGQPSGGPSGEHRYPGRRCSPGRALPEGMHVGQRIVGRPRSEAATSTGSRCPPLR